MDKGANKFTKKEQEIMIISNPHLNFSTPVPPIKNCLVTLHIFFDACVYKIAARWRPVWN